MGSDYWEGLIDWINEKMLHEHGYIDPEDMDVFTVVDDPQAAAKIIVDFREAQKPAGIELPMGMKKHHNR
jgi:predicted Rossmann-fold nucleotide-binding protein